MKKTLEDKKIESLSEETLFLQRRAEDLKITDNSTLMTATEMLGQIASKKKQVEERRQFLVKPLNDQVRAINAWIKGISAPLEELDRILRKEVLRYRQEQEKIRQEEEARLQEKQRRDHKRAEKDGESVSPIPVPTLIIPSAPKTVSTDFGTVTVRKEWVFEIIDESQISREYLSVDERKIRAAIKAGIRNIAGVRVFEEEDLTVRKSFAGLP